MQGRTSLCWALLFLSSSGCHETPNVADDPPGRVEAKTNQFDPATAGVIQGRATWTGPLPEVPDFEVHAYLDYLNVKRLQGRQPNPHAPAIDVDSRGIAEVLIRLDRIDPSRAKPWAHAPVAVEMQPERLTVHQGDACGRIGIVQRGAQVAFTNRDAEYHLLRARGAAFFSLPFVVADQPTKRVLDNPGLAELSEGGGCYWRRAYLAVMEHPYAVVSDRAGRFELDQAPAGTYRLTAWLPNWQVERREHEPETAVIARIYFAPAVKLEQTVTVNAGQTTTVDLNFAIEQFSKRR